MKAAGKGMGILLQPATNTVPTVPSADPLASQLAQFAAEAATYLNSNTQLSLNLDTLDDVARNTIVLAYNMVNDSIKVESSIQGFQTSIEPKSEDTDQAKKVKKILSNAYNALKTQNLPSEFLLFSLGMYATLLWLNRMATDAELKNGSGTGVPVAQFVIEFVPMDESGEQIYLFTNEAVNGTLEFKTSTGKKSETKPARSEQEANEAAVSALAQNVNVVLPLYQAWRSRTNLDQMQVHKYMEYTMALLDQVDAADIEAKLLSMNVNNVDKKEQKQALLRLLNDPDTIPDYVEEDDAAAAADSSAASAAAAPQQQSGGGNAVPPPANGKQHTVPELQTIITTNGGSLPTTGSGKDGKVVRMDYVDLVNQMIPTANIKTDASDLMYDNPYAETDSDASSTTEEAIADFFL